MREENKPLISIVVPCFNEEEVLPVYIEEMGKIIDKMQRAEVELIFVDDGSTDRTLSLLMEFRQRSGNVCRLSGGKGRLCGCDGCRPAGSAGIYSLNVSDFEKRGV